MTLLRQDPILCLGGFDPSGSAGLLADARMILAHGGRPWLMMLLDTCQNRQELRGVDARPVTWLQQQWQILAAEASPVAIKLGAVANQAQADWLAVRLRGFRGPVVMDPVLSSSTGVALASAAAVRQLAPLASVLTPNRDEAAALFDVDPDDPRWTGACTAPLLVTGADHAAERGHDRMTHRLLTAEGHHDFSAPRHAGRYRGTGCLLASALACALAAGMAMVPACQHALQTVLRWIESAQRFEDGIHLPAPPR